jgi:Tfp pilus assembly protein PilN
MVAFMLGFAAGAMDMTARGINRQAIDSLQRDNALLRQKADLLPQELDQITAALARPDDAEAHTAPHQ